MALLQDSVRIVDIWSGEECEARFVELTRSIAKSSVDSDWWVLPDVSRSARASEGDHHWKWSKLVGSHRNDLAWEFTALQSPDGAVQGAIAYRLDAVSFIEPKVNLVYIDRLATAPRNRHWLVDKPRYRGVGSALLLRAVHHSYLLGLGGRVALVSLPSERTRSFYAQRGFTVAASMRTT